MRVRILVLLCLVIALSTLLGGGRVQEHAQADEVRGRAATAREMGEHAVTAALAGSRLELALKRGFEVKLRSARSRAPVALRVAETRAASDAIAPGFVPIGPTVTLALDEGTADVSFVADHFRVRRGHRLVLARETAAPCAAGGPCWELLPAAYVNGRCLARALPVHAGRLQFGSLPVPP